MGKAHIGTEPLRPGGTTPQSLSLDNIASRPPSSGSDSTHANTSPSSDTSGRTSPPISLTFHDSGSFFSKPTANTVTFPETYPIFPSARNGTPLTEAATYLKSPRKAATVLGRAAHRKATSLDWDSFRKKLEGATEMVTESITSRVNQAMEGRDAVRVLHKAQDLVASPLDVLPSGRRVGKALDGFGDAVQQMWVKKTNNNSPGENGDSTVDAEDDSSKESQVARGWQFAYHMGTKAREALIRHRILAAWQVRHTRDNLAWQMRLDQALSDLYNCFKDEYGFETFVQMEPLWVCGKGNMWRLFVDTGISEIGDELEETPIRLDTGFELEGTEGGVP